MASRIPKKILLICVVFVTIVLLIHGYKKDYFHVGVLQSEKSRYIDVSRIWRDSNQKTEVKENYTGADEGNTTVKDLADFYIASNITDKLADTMKIDFPSEEAQAETSPVCTRRNNIGFFKMHKCSSSTVQNILMRYGDRNNLNFVLPPAGNYLGQTYFNKRFVMTFPVKEYNILCHHTRFSKEGFDSVLPENSAYVTIIRDPATMFESTFTYLNYPARYGIPAPDALATFLANPNHYYVPHSGKNHAKDSMLYDLGLENELKEVDIDVEKKIQAISEDFDLVMMTEYFAESLILLKDLMCWDFEDITYFKMNARSKTSIKQVSSSLAQQMRDWNRGDTRLYDHFNRTFWGKVRAFGEDRMRREVQKLEQMNEMMKERCIDKVIVNDKQVWHPSGINVESFKVKDSALNDKDCTLMAKTELPFTAYIRQKQLEKYFGRRALAL